MARVKLNKRELLVAFLFMIFVSSHMLYRTEWMGEYRNKINNDNIAEIEGAIICGEISEEDVFEMAENNNINSSGLQELLNDGYLIGYMDEMKAEGMIPQDFFISGSSSSGSNSSSFGSSSSTKICCFAKDECNALKQERCEDQLPLIPLWLVGVFLLMAVIVVIIIVVVVVTFIHTIKMIDNSRRM